MTTEEQTKRSDSKWIWPFEILEQIGEGGMGVVYRARYVVNDRIVALKMLPADVTDKTALARFERELEVLKGLQHPHIVRCFGGTSKDKRQFYAMELLEGGSLEDRLQQKGRFPWEEVIQYGLQMCAALEGSHSKNVVHRDIKPSNFLLTETGKLKLSDFGLASVSASRKITAAGKTAGTFLYMAPEQIRGKEITPQTDLYALGCVLFELITGRPPFVGDTPAQTLHLHCHEKPPRPTSIALDCPVSLEKLILDLLEKSPDDRPQSAAAVARDLRIVSQTVTVVSRPSMLEAAVAKDRPDKTTELKRKPDSLPTVGQRMPYWVTILVLSVLAMSLSANFFGHFAAGHQRRWQEMWIEASNHPDREVRIVAMESIGRMEGRSRGGVEALIDGLGDVDDSVRLAAATGLANTGERAKPAVPTLIRVQKEDPSTEVRNAASLAITSISESKGQGHKPWFGITIATIITIGISAAVFYWMYSS